mmetsp:Transcript_42436/g.99636  ORF Transcript_42436/g.99636 Transcript_42436/m.99636 type:complete len:279 (-) Transcript_42436:263-1099(-)
MKDRTRPRLDRRSKSPGFRQQVSERSLLKRADKRTKGTNEVAKQIFRMKLSVPKTQVGNDQATNEESSESSSELRPQRQLKAISTPELGIERRNTISFMLSPDLDEEEKNKLSPMSSLDLGEEQRNIMSHSPERKGPLSSHRFDYEFTALHSICKTSSVGNNENTIDMVKYLVSTGGRLSAMIDEHGCTPLHYACSSGMKLEVINYLINADPSACTVQDNQGRLPLHNACSKPKAVPEVILALYRSFLPAVDIKDDYGNTPLQYNEKARDLIDLVNRF